MKPKTLLRKSGKYICHSLLRTKWMIVLFIFGAQNTFSANLDCSVTQKQFSTWIFSYGEEVGIKPADSYAFPQENTNCSFYQWAQQMFLWITSPSQGYGRVFQSPAFFTVTAPFKDSDNNPRRALIPHNKDSSLSFSPAIDLKGHNRLPVITHKETGVLYEVDTPVLSKNGRYLVLNKQGIKVEIGEISIRNGTPIFFDSSGKKISGVRPLFNKGVGGKRLVQQYTVKNRTVYLDADGDNVETTEVGQAGGSAVLMAQNGSLVYYSLLVNDVLAVYRSMGDEHQDNPNKFPSSKDELRKIVSYGRYLGYQISNANMNALAMELKLSWVKAYDLPNPDSYITIKADIPEYKKVSIGGQEQWQPTGSEEKNVKLALVGMHVVGNVAGHPEMLWATYEHTKTAPLGDYSYVNNAGKNVSVPQDTGGEWVLSTRNARGPFNVQRMKVAGQSDTGSKAGNIIPLQGQSIGASDTLRDNPWGVVEGTTPNQNVSTAAESNSQILSLNNSMSGAEGLLGENDVRRHYFLVGNTWTEGGKMPTGEYSQGGNEVGTSRLANATMETYHQSLNCFACHNDFSQEHNNFTNLSHIYSELLPLEKNNSTLKAIKNLAN